MANLANIDAATCVRSDVDNYKTLEHSHAHHAMLLFPVTGTMTVRDENCSVRRLVERDYFYYVEAGLAHYTWANRIRQEHIAVYLNRDWQKFVFKNVGLGRLTEQHSGIWALSETGIPLASILTRKLMGLEPDPFKHADRLVELLAEDCLIRMSTAAPEMRGHPREHGVILVREAVALLRDNLAEPPSLDELAEQLSISRRHISRLFRNSVGLSVSQFVRAERFKEAARLIQETEWSIQQVASHVGLDNSANFTTSFKRETGTTPSELRKRHRVARS